MPLVYHVITDKNVGGGGRVLSAFLRHSDRKRLSSCVLLPKGSLLSPILSKDHISCMELSEVSDTSLSFSAVRRLFRLFKEAPPDAVVAHASLSARLAGRLARVPLLLAVKHCATPLSPFLSPLYNTLTDATVAVSSNARDALLASHIPSERIYTVENGFSFIGVPTEKERRAARACFGIPDGVLAVGLSGRLVPIKGHKTALDALKNMGQDRERILLLFLGDGGEEATLRAYARALGVEGQVRFLGFMSEVRAFYHALDAHISCSSGSETASLALAEGMSAGCATLASDIEGNRARVGAGGLFFSPGDSDALAALFLRLCDVRERMRLSRAALARAKELPSEKESAARLDALLLALLAKKGHAP